MKPYIAYDLDALDAAPLVARASGISDDAAVAGNARLWAWCWKTKTDRVKAEHLSGFYGSTTAAPALVAFGFLEVDEGGFRVKGAERYLRLTAARRSGALKTNKTLAERRSSVAPAHAERTLPNALSSSIEHRTPSIEKEEEAPPPPKAPVEPPRITAPDSPALAFFCWAQDKRTGAGLIREKPPHTAKLGTWYSTALSQTQGDEERLREAFLSFGDDVHWQKAKPPLPFAAFMAQWDSYAARARQAAR